MFKLYPWQIEAVKRLHEEYKPIDKKKPPIKTCPRCYNVHGTAKKRCECGYIFIEEVNYFENESMMDEPDVQGGLSDSEHEHNMFETTTVCSTERTYVCLICGHTETEPMFLTIERKDK